jgi:hypothetical protein
LGFLIGVAVFLLRISHCGLSRNRNEKTTTAMSNPQCNQKFATMEVLGAIQILEKLPE